MLIYYDEREEFRKEDKEDEEDEENEEEQDKKQFDLDEFIKQTFNKEKLPIDNELFKKHFKLEKPILIKVLHETKNDKEVKLVNQ